MLLQWAGGTSQLGCDAEEIKSASESTATAENKSAEQSPEKKRSCAEHFESGR
jgi:hypothetical protein